MIYIMGDKELVLVFSILQIGSVESKPVKEELKGCALTQYFAVFKKTCPKLGERYRSFVP